MYNHPNIIRYLVSKDADTELLDTDQRTPLLLAATRGSWQSVHTLIELGANFMVKVSFKKTFMMMITLFFFLGLEKLCKLRHLNFACNRHQTKKTC